MSMTCQCSGIIILNSLLHVAFSNYFSDLGFHHFQATTYLKVLDEHQICYVGGALGLTYDDLGKMKDLPEEMVTAWLRRDNFVQSMSGEPTWRTLVEALRKVGLEGTATDIEKAESR